MASLIRVDLTRDEIDMLREACRNAQTRCRESASVHERSEQYDFAEFMKARGHQFGVLITRLARAVLRKETGTAPP